MNKPRAVGCLWSIIGICGVVIIGLLYLLLAPAQPTAASFPVFSRARTYLEVHIESHHGGWPEGTQADEYDTIELYYAHLGGWFKDAQRVLVASKRTIGHIQGPPIRFYQQPGDSLAPIKIRLFDKDSTEFNFEPSSVSSAINLETDYPSNKKAR